MLESVEVIYFEFQVFANIAVHWNSCRKGRKKEGTEGVRMREAGRGEERNGKEMERNEKGKGKKESHIAF